jgi:cysteine protease ATG4
MTYRKDLYQLLGNTYSSDVGWGCMLRVIQMIIAQAILRAVEHKDPLDHVITLVLDVADKDIAPLSIYNLLEQEIPGKWFGPHHAAYNASKCLKAYKNPPIDVIVCQDGLVVESTLKPKSCILITLQLGLEAINPCYVHIFDFLPVFIAFLV